MVTRFDQHPDRRNIWLVAGLGTFGAACCSLVCSAAFLAEPAASAVTVIDETGAAHQVDAELLSTLKRHAAMVQHRDGSRHAWEGPHLGDVLTAAGVSLGSDLRGERLALYLVAEAADGYRVVFSLAEVDPSNTDALILLADRHDGAPLDADDGPLRIIVPHEKPRGRWVRQVLRLGVYRAAVMQKAGSEEE
jgi:hypothetical protein